VDVDAPVDPPRTRFGLIFAVVVVAGTVGMWIYLFLLADPNVPDQLDDQGYSEAAQEICEATIDRIDALPPAQDAETPEARGATLTEANALLAEMLDDLAAITPTDDHDGPLVEAWLADWRTFLVNRGEYAEELLAGNEDAELLVTARDDAGGQITVTLDHFAEINNMEDCVSPLDA
jgi:hypothetical protein